MGFPHIVVRADASSRIGAGHVVRCLALAEALRERGVRVTFVSRDLPGAPLGAIGDNGFELRLLAGPEAAPVDVDAAETLAAIVSDPADAVVVDSYELTAEWETAMRSATPRIVAVDDGAQRDHDCDVLVDHSILGHADVEMGPYRGRVPEGCEMILGPHFALLRPDFSVLHDAAEVRDGEVGRVLVSFGGADASDMTSLTLDAIEPIVGGRFAVDVVIGAANPHRVALEQAAAGIGATVHVDTRWMAALMTTADLAVGAAGGMAWERCCLGLPAVVVSLAHNQDAIAEACDRQGVARFAGRAGDIGVDRLRETLAGLIEDASARATMSARGLALVDGRGAERVAERLLAGVGS